jgi:hypothetical protein
MDKSLRNTLRIIITQARKILEKAIEVQLEGQFGIHINGIVEDISSLGTFSEEDQQYRKQILAHLDHIQAAEFQSLDAVAQLVREVSFTHLNRLCAYKMMEKRQLIREAVSRGTQSRGFKYYLADHEEDLRLWEGGQQDLAYKHFLLWLGDTLSDEIGVLFSPHDSASHLFPSQRVLEQVLGLLNDEKLNGIWSEDETIGWVYQYFTPKELRDQARNESQAPRNSYELAFRNQFYTPRYVVRFLTDNTLGRIWYEMRQGKTRIVEQCTYMVRRPDEVFLSEANLKPQIEEQRWLQGEDVPEPPLIELAHTVNAYTRVGSFSEEANEWVEERLPHITPEHVGTFKTQELLDLLFLLARKERFCEGTLNSLRREIELIRETLRQRVQDQKRENRGQQELLQAPFWVSYRAPKDPRDLKILDPACGSGHFLLYCFDLLTTIYEEAYEDDEAGKHLREEYSSLEALRRAVPALILEHNLHGIDIDLRATQIAALSLWLRAQRAYQEMGIKRDERPKITRSNIVYAEPMPGEQELLKEFTGQLHPPILGQLVTTIFEKMKLASEAGSLLKIEEEIHEEVQNAKSSWLSRPPTVQLSLFPQSSTPTYTPLVEEEPQTELTDETFWNVAETLVINALHDYAHNATNGHTFARQLFADDAVQGFAFIDICQKPFDVVLMNPPFGEASKPSKVYIEGAYPRTKNDIYAAFVERWFGRLDSGGLLGAITSRTGFFLTSFRKWREDILLKDAHPTVFADLGYGVLDTAMVETAAYCLGNKTTNDTLFFQMLFYEDKTTTLEQAIKETSEGDVFNTATHVANPVSFKQIPGSTFAYWISEQARQSFTRFPSLGSNGRTAKQGLATADDFRFLRVWWEVKTTHIVSGYLENNVEYFHQQTFTQKQWIPFAKGGKYSQYYSDIHLLLNWKNDGEEIKQRINPESGYPYSNVWQLKGTEQSYFFRPGLTWPRRTNGLSFRLLPKGCIFSDKGPVIFDESTNLLTLAALINSQSFYVVICTLIARVSLAQSFEVGLIQSTPLPEVGEDDFLLLRDLALNCFNIKRNLDVSVETSHSFCLPELLSIKERSLTKRIAGWQANYDKASSTFAKLQQEINSISARLYAIPEEDYQATNILLEQSSTHTANRDTDGEQDEAEEQVLNASLLTKNLLSYLIGCFFARWDIRYATNDYSAFKLPEPLAPLPACSPGMLTGEDGLPLKETPENYPLSIKWDGIVVDDEDHSDDAIRRVREVLSAIWNEQAEAIEQEICGILEIKDLREYFRKPGKGGFWVDHIQRYSKSRRKAPIYWLLQSSKRNYSLWLYYHRLDKDILFKALVNYVEPKLRLEESRVELLRTQIKSGGLTGREARQAERQLERQENFLVELQDFRDKLRRAADLGLEPDLNDGVVLNIAPLWELVPWNEAKKYWDELLAGKYEWSSISKQLRAKGKVR